jgi:DNA ligase (NAD+)
MEKVIKQIILDPFNVIDDMDIEQLENVITVTSDKYYNTNTSLVSDAIYDLMIDFLKEKNPKSKVLKHVGARTKNDKVKLPYHMGSMDKIKPPSNHLDKWLKTYNAPYILTDKLDGVSGLIVYDKDIKLYSRGTSEEGQDITHLLKYFENIPDIKDIKKIFGNKRVAFRGELLISKKIFEKKWSSKLKNPRNSVAGLVNSKHIDPYLAKDTNLVIYEIVDPLMKMSEQIIMLNDTSFDVVHHKILNKIDYEILSEHFKNRRKSGKYEVDGVIVTNDEKHERNDSGNPEYAFAFKDVLEDQIAQSKIVNIEWNVSKDGYLKPVVIIEKTRLGGVDVSRLTAFNAKYVVDNNLGIGAIIEFIRSGDVIPKIQRVIKPAKSVKLPVATYEWTESGVDIIMSEYSQDQLLKQIHYFFATLDTKNLGEGNIKKMIDSGLNSVKKILNANKTDLAKVNGFKERSVENIYQSIKDATKNIDLAILMKASGKLGHNFGKSRSKGILEKYPDILTKKRSEKEWIKLISDLEGFNTITATQFAVNLDKFLDFYDDIKQLISLKKTIKKSGKFNGKIFVLTGFRDGDLQKSIENEGGRIGSSISKNTDYVIVKDKSMIDNSTDKLEKAKKLNIKIISKDKIFNMV